MPAPYRYALGVIGVGNMGAALVRGCLRRAALAPAEVAVCDAEAERAESLGHELGVTVLADAEQTAAQAQRILLAVKPQTLPDLLPPLRGRLLADQTVISIAAGVPLARLRGWIGDGPGLVRVMPNLPATVGAGAAAYCTEAGVGATERAFVQGLLSSVGLALSVEERLMDAVTGLAGSGPAFAAVFCEALADAGVAAGLPRAAAQQLAAQVLVGSGQWILQAGSPAQLKDAVSSPAGTTIAGVQALERGGLRAATAEAVAAAVRRSAELGQKANRA